MAKASMNIQDSFLNQTRKEGGEVKFVMVDGSSLIGQVKGFDNFTVVVQSRNAQHLLYKHAISQIISRKPSRREDADDTAAEPAAAPPPPAPAPAAVAAAKPSRFNPPSVDLSGVPGPGSSQ
jgi:host factor-I protein